MHVASHNLPVASPPISELQVEGMTCNNCARKVTDAIQSVSGVQSVMVNLEACRVSVRWKTDAIAVADQLVHAATAAGYPAKLLELTRGSVAAPRRRWHLNLWIGGLVTAVLMLGEWGFHFGMTGWFAWASFILAGLVQVFCGAQFYRGAWRQLQVGSSNMDTLVALGSTTAFGYSVWSLFSGRGGHLYFMEAAAIITLISVGHWVEARVSARAADALHSLMQLAPVTARRLQTGAVASPPKFNPRDILNFKPVSVAPTIEVEVPVAELKIADLIVLRPGDQVPVDGMVTEGNSAVNEAMLTGESLPVEKAAGAKVFTGTANLNGRLVLQVTATGESTALAHIIAAVQRAQTSRADIQRLGDRVSNVFVPVVAMIAVLAGLAWGFLPEFMTEVFHAVAPYLWPAHLPTGAGAGFIIAAAVLIVACPCAMGLATPAAIMASANAAARRGILIRDGVALEKAGRITAVVFDKTGTLTQGKPEVVAVFEIDNQKAERAGLAAALASHSTHPISQAIARMTPRRVELQEWQEVRGDGVEAKLKSAAGGALLARLGSLRWLQATGVKIERGENFIKEWSAQGATVVGWAVEKDLMGLMAVRDTLKTGAVVVVERLQQQGLKTYLLTGDNRFTATGIANQVGIALENVFAEVRPEQKAELLKELQARGERVAFVGDGINDAPALTQADLGIAVSRASDVAREAADLILLKSEIEAAPEALALARATLRTIKQNLFWAFFYNAVGIPLAALGFMSPVLCAAAMGLSDLVVIGNALRLKWYLAGKVPQEPPPISSAPCR